MEKRGISQNNNQGMKEIFKFLAGLARNNNREWFQSHKEQYDTLRKVFEFMVQELIEEISTFDSSVSGLQAKACIFRIYRDTRFSHDKTPYKTHFGAWIARGGRKSEYPGYYLHFEPGHCIFAAGIWHPDPNLLKMVRREIYEHIEEFKEILSAPEFLDIYETVQGSSLRTIPRGYPKDFEDGHLLMLKDYFAEKGVPDSFFDENWVHQAGKILQVAHPLNVFLGHVVDEYENK